MGQGLNVKEEYYYEGWCKNTFEFYNKDRSKCLTFSPYYRSDIGKTITIEQARKEGCEYIQLNGLEVGDEVEESK